MKFQRFLDCFARARNDERGVQLLAPAVIASPCEAIQESLTLVTIDIWLTIFSGNLTLYI
ncbi:MAG: hypothetical protein WCG04_06375 [Alphaproteobacteria bacterium]